jgi:hypothetical protein
MTYIFDCEVFAYDWLFVFKEIESGAYTVIHNDNEAIKQFMESDPLLCGFNNKHYDQFILKAVLADASPEMVKEVNDHIISGGVGWEHPLVRGCRIYFDQFDLFDDCQMGLSLKAIEAHLGMDIKESEVDFNIDHPLTTEELEETILYCKHDVDATEKLYHLRKGYLENKLTLGRVKGITDTKALYMTNAKLTAAYLDAQPKEHSDEREYVYPDNLLREYIPNEVFEFFNRLYDKNLSDEEVFTSKLKFNIGDCQVTLGYGGIHGAIPCYRERATENRSIRNQDVASYYPHLMVIEGYCSRSIPNPKIYEDMLEARMKAKRSGDKATANALKLVANTTYGAMLNGKNGVARNDLYDPLMGRSVCITGQLRLLELSNHLVAECPSLKIIQLNTDGIMVSLDDDDLNTYDTICKEWQARGGYELEEDRILEIIQKDVNGYVEIATDGSTKIKGGYLVRGIAPAGAFNVNNNTTIVAKALLDYFSKGVPVEDTINNCDDLLSFQLIAKASGLYSAVHHIVNGEKIPVQKCNRVYATRDKRYGTLIKTHAVTGGEAKIGGLPEHCMIDNTNVLTIDSVDKEWYINLAKKQVNDFLGIEPPKKNTRKINSIKKQIIKMLEE